MLTGAGIVLATVAAVVAVYLGVRRMMRPDPDERTQDLAGSVLFRISALHGLVIALVFASEVVEYQQIALESTAEANAVSDIYYDAARYGAATATVQDALVAYLQIVPTEEWARLGERGSLSDAAWVAWDQAYGAILDLEPTTPREAALRENMLEKIHIVAENRDLREYHAQSRLSPLFWIAAVAGVVLLSVGYYPFAPIRDNLILISVFAAYTGFILFTIFAMANPFRAPAALEPVLFEELLIELAGPAG